MGFPISPVIANIFMEHFEKEAILRKRLGKTPKKSEVWFRRQHIRDMETRQSRTP